MNAQQNSDVKCLNDMKNCVAYYIPDPINEIHIISNGYHAKFDENKQKVVFLCHIENASNKLVKSALICIQNKLLLLGGEEGWND